MVAYLFDGYWEDIGTIKSFFDANLALAQQPPRFEFYDQTAPIYTSPRFLPPAKGECFVWGVLCGENGFVLFLLLFSKHKTPTLTHTTPSL